MMNYRLDSKWCRVLPAVMLTILAGASPAVAQQDRKSVV